MDKEKIIALYIKLIKSELCGVKLSDADVDALKDKNIVKAIYDRAKLHDLLHVLGNAFIKSGVAEKGGDFYKELVKAQALTIYRYEKNQYELDRLCKFLEDEKFEFLPLKGSVLRSYYPYPEMRTSCDIDILVKPEEVDRIAQLLVEKFGYTYEKKYDHDVALYSESNVHLELHFKLQDDENDWDRKTDKYFNRVWQHVSPKKGWNYHMEMDNEMFTGYILVHMAKHFVRGGCGVRSFMDLWVIKNKIGFDEKRLYSILSKCSMEKFGRAAFALTDAWFGNGEINDTLRQMQLYVIRGGIYGGKANAILVENAKRDNKFRYMWDRIFPPFKKFSIIHPTLKKCPILYPVFMIARWFRIIFSRGRVRASREIKYVNNISEQEKQQILDLCDKLGV